MYDFTQRKFLELPLERQHKKCFELLRHLYDRLIAGQSISNELALYNELALWMQQEPLHHTSFQSISDRYHWHLHLSHTNKREHHLLPKVRKGDSSEKKADYWPIAIYLDHIRSAHNIGSILRTVEALQIGTVYFSDQTPYIDHKQVQDTSMGTYHHVPCKKGEALHTLPRPIIALETSSDAISLYDFIFPNSFTLVLGNEEYGCSDSTLEEADYILEIPLRGSKNSLNVANAFALVAGEIHRQRILEC